MRAFSLIVILIVAISCSTYGPGRAYSDRSPASIGTVFNSCKKGILNFFDGTSEKKVKETLIKLQNNEPITSKDKRRLLKLSHNIPFEADRMAVEKAIKTDAKFSKTELESIRNFIGRDIMLSHNTNPSLYKKLYVGGDQNLLQTYGIEFELILDEVPAILNSYRIKAVTEQQWYSLSLEQRLKLAKKAQKEADDVDDIFTRLSSANPKLPEGLFVEPHGTIEGNGLIFDNLGELHELITYMSEHFGKFSWQPHLVMDANAEFKGMAGYSIYEFERNQLTVLEKGFNRYLKQPKAIPSANIVHYSLGPMDQKIASNLIEADEYLENGVMDITISGVKSMSAPHFRVNGPYGKDKMGFELRQFHKRYEEMFDSLTRLARDIDEFGGLGHYSRFTEAEQVSKNTLKDTLGHYGIPKEQVDDFELFFYAMSDEILQYNKRMGGARGGADYEHRLLYPLKDWLNHPIRKTLDGAEKEAYDKMTKTHQLEFIKEIQKLMDKYDITEVTPEALDEVRILIASWAHKSDYSQFFERFGRTVKGEKRDLQYSYLPKLEFFEDLGEKTYKYKGGASENIAFNNYIMNTIEIAYRDIGETGHMELRVGNKHYTVNGFFSGRTDAKSKPFQGFKAGANGKVFRLDRAKMKEAKNLIESYVASARTQNFPPYDLYGSDELVQQVKGGFRMVESKNKALIKASIEEIAGKKYFVNGTVKIPVVEREGQYYIRTTNCTRVVTDILSKYLDFDIGSYASAGMLNNALENGRTLKPFDVEVQY